MLMFFHSFLPVEKRLLDSQGDPDGTEGNEPVKDLTDILGDFPSAILRHIQSLLLLDDVKGTQMIHGAQEDTDKHDDTTVKDTPTGEDHADLNKKDCIGLDSLHQQLDHPAFNMMICGI